MSDKQVKFSMSPIDACQKKWSGQNRVIFNLLESKRCILSAHTGLQKIIAIIFFLKKIIARTDADFSANRYWRQKEKNNESHFIYVLSNVYLLDLSYNIYFKTSIILVSFSYKILSWLYNKEYNQCCGCDLTNQISATVTNT